MRIHKHAAKHLKHWLIPHKRNDHRPHLIRAHGLAVVAVLILGVQASALAIHASSPTPLVKGGNVLSYATGSITPVELLNLTNQERAANGLGALRLDSRLNNSASLKAQNMFAEDYWNHVSPSCIDPWHWFSLAGYPYTFAGENLAKDFDTSAGVMAGWMASPGHKANILNSHYTDVGFSVQNGLSPTDSIPTSGLSSYTTPSCHALIAQANEQTTLVVAHYGTTAGSVAAAPATPKIVPKPAVAAATTPALTPTPTAAALTPAPPPPPALTPQEDRPVVSGHIYEGTSAPEPAGYSLFRPLSILRTLNWNTLAVVGLLTLLLAVYLATHVTVWRKGLGRWRSAKYKMFAAGQLSALAIVITLLAISGFGRVG